MDRPEIFVLGGPNGAGKTTIANVLLPEHVQVSRFVNADLIARGLDPYLPQASEFEAGRLMLERIHQLREVRESFAFETTLASRSFAPFLRDARELGYRIHVVYVWLSNVETALRRIRTRVREGGHDVPERTVRRRFTRGLANLFDLYQPLADTWTVCDNSGDELIVVARSRQGAGARVYVPATWARIEEHDRNANA